MKGLSNVCKQNVPADGEKALIAINATYNY